MFFAKYCDLIQVFVENPGSDKIKRAATNDATPFYIL